MAWTRRYEEAEPQRVNRWLAQSGVCSRREAESLIAQGLVSIDGERVEDAGRKIQPGQTLTLADAAEARLEGHVSIVLHKPAGVVSSLPDRGQPEATDLLTHEAFWGAGAPPSLDGVKLGPLGRLDMDSRGLLILSDDGVLAKAVIGPESKLDKEYRVFVMGEVTERKIALLRHGLSLDGRRLRPAKVERIGDNRLKFVLTEGRNRQIRRMCEQVDLKVVDLFRVRIGPLRLSDAMAERRWRVLTADERAALLRAS